MRFLKFDPDRTVRAICAAGILLWAYLLTVKFVNYGYYDWDLSLYSQAMWRMIHGSLDVSLFGMNFFGNHAEYISFLVAPFYFLMPHPLTLVYINVIAFFIAAYVFYFIFKRFLSPWTAVVFCCLYVMYPPNLFMLVYEFHFESLALPFIAGMFLFLLEKRFIAFMICGVLACLCKENIPSILVMFGLASFFRKGVDRRIWGMIPVITGLAYFILVMFVVIPYIRRDLPHSGNIYLGMFSRLGTEPGEIMISLLTKPWLVWQILVSNGNLFFLNELFSSVSFISFLCPWPLFIGMPILLQSLFSSAPQFHTIFFHYTATLAPFIFVSAAAGAGVLMKFLRQRSFHFIMVILLFSAVGFVCKYQVPLISRFHFQRDVHDDLYDSMVQRVPPGASVVASFKFLNHLSNRDGLYAFYNVWLGKNLLTGRTYVLPDTVQYALVDLADPWLAADYRLDPENVDKRVQAFMADGWQVRSRSQDTYLMQRSFK
ncbi:MAG: DUF2079 domain-containing protein [Candidatus Omnitrophica bacterium]|nr:DUF2079 domain-containing protein [Candidatus Omnitrophota bacterium]